MLQPADIQLILEAAAERQRRQQERHTRHEMRRRWHRLMALEGGGERERSRRLRQIATGYLRWENGLR